MRPRKQTDIASGIIKHLKDLWRHMYNRIEVGQVSGPFMTLAWLELAINDTATVSILDIGFVALLNIVSVLTTSRRMTF